MKCPKCVDETMSSFGPVEGVEVDFCSKCKGVWFDKGEMAFYVETPDDVPDLDAAIEAGTASGAACPSCSTGLVETHYVPSDPLRIDICPSCRGIFLDSGELPKVEALAARQGGLEKVVRTAKALEAKGYVILGLRRP